AGRYEIWDVYMCAGRDRGWPAIDIECRGWGGGCGLCGPRVIACVIAGAVAGEGEGVFSRNGKTARSGCEEGDMTAVVLDARRRREEADGNDRAHAWAVDAVFAVYVQRSDGKGRKPTGEFARLSRALGGRGPDATIRGRGATHKRRGRAIARLAQR
ncbi:hypothetical protein POSPLADRAFT_1143859, partial [Postia placenta MAD-698-R-SB12]